MSARRADSQWQCGGVDGGLGIVLAQLGQVFAPYPRRAVLDGCPHCRTSTSVDEHDLFSLTIRLGNTVGDREDVKSLLPLLFERLVTSNDLDPGIVLSKLTQEQWRTWPPVEQRAIEEYLDAVWRSLLAEFPSRVGAFVDAAKFFDAALRLVPVSSGSWLLGTRSSARLPISTLRSL